MMHAARLALIVAVLIASPAVEAQMHQRFAAAADVTLSSQSLFITAERYQ